MDKKVLTAEQVDDMRKAIKCAYTTIGGKIKDDAIKRGYAQMPERIDALCDLALQALAQHRSPLLERAARLLGAEAMHYRNSDTMGGKLRYQQLLEAANAIYTELGQPESIMPLPGATFADGVDAAAKWCDENSVKAQDSGRSEDASLLSSAAFCIRAIKVPS